MSSELSTSKSASSQPPLLKLNALAKNYAKREILSGITLEFKSPGLIGIAGPSGCGKTTLLNIIGMADRPDRGELYLAGQKIDYSNEQSLIDLRRQEIGYVFQFFNLLPTLTATENVMLPALLRGFKSKSADLLARKLLTQVGLENRLNAKPSQLSGGEMQRVAICRAIIHRPRIIVADEPTGSLDSASGEQIIKLLRSLSIHDPEKKVEHEACSGNILVIMASHNHEALAYCDQVVQLRDGKVDSKILEVRYTTNQQEPVA